MDKSSFLRKVPGVLGAAIAAGSAAYSLGTRAASSIDRSRTFPTWSTPSRVVTVGDRWSTMPMKYRPSRPVGGRRRVYRRRMYAMYGMQRSIEYPKRIVRTTALSSAALVGGLHGQLQNISLNQVQTSDLLAMYRNYRIRKVVLHLYPRFDPGNSGIANNAQFAVCAACDSEGAAATPATLTSVGAYGNHRQVSMVTAQEYKYTFYPKAVNTVDISGTASAVGSYGMNPWLQLTALGITVPHRQLLFYVQSSNPTATFNVDWWFDIHFDVKGVA